MKEFVRKEYRAESVANIRGNSVHYTSIVENFPIHDKAGDVAASMFTSSYICVEKEVCAQRPVIFAWNGGPGCGSLYVHLGLLAPRIVNTENVGEDSILPPFEIVDNENCLLDTCDLVVVDAINTGYSRLLKDESGKEFFSTEGDAAAFVECIRAWLIRHSCWNRPVYIMGESYGTIRNALVAGDMFYHNRGFRAGAPFHISGIIMIGTRLNYGQADFPVPESAVLLPNIAATNWYWNPDGKESLKDYVEGCIRFCEDEYVRALFMGSNMPEEEKLSVAEKLSAYTGYSVDSLLEKKLEIDLIDFAVRDHTIRGKTIGIYDSRFSFEGNTNGDKADIFGDDPSNQVIMPMFTSAYYNYFREALNIGEDEEYVEFMQGADDWELKTAESPMKTLEKAMFRNPKLRIMFCMGYYDLTCTIGWVRYLLSHYNLPPERTVLKYYESGHMAYVGKPQTMQLEEDIRQFVKE